MKNIKILLPLSLWDTSLYPDTDPLSISQYVKRFANLACIDNYIYTVRDGGILMSVEDVYLYNIWENMREKKEAFEYFLSTQDDLNKDISLYESFDYFLDHVVLFPEKLGLLTQFTVESQVSRDFDWQAYVGGVCIEHCWTKKVKDEKCTNHIKL